MFIQRGPMLHESSAPSPLFVVIIFGGADKDTELLSRRFKPIWVTRSHLSAALVLSSTSEVRAGRQSAGQDLFRQSLPASVLQRMAPEPRRPDVRSAGIQKVGEHITTTPCHLFFSKKRQEKHPSLPQTFKDELILIDMQTEVFLVPLCAALSSISLQPSAPFQDKETSLLWFCIVVTKCSLKIFFLTVGPFKPEPFSPRTPLP